MSENQRVKIARKALGKTQSEMSEGIGITQGAYSDLERGKNQLSYTVLKGLRTIFNINSEYLITGLGDIFIGGGDNYANLNANLNANLMGEPAPEYKKNSTYFEAPGVSVVDASGNSVIPVLDIRAAAGYASHVQDVGYIQDMPSLSLPWHMFRTGTHICIQVSGSSMREAIQHMDYVVCRQVIERQTFIKGEVYVIVTRDGVVCKRLESFSSESLHLISDNPVYGGLSISLHSILQIWEGRAVINMNLEPIQPLSQITEILDRVKRLEAR